MIKEDSLSFLTELWDGARDQVVTELLPALERQWVAARERSEALYAAHLATAVDEHLMPVMEAHVYPTYYRHVRPTYNTTVAPAVTTVRGAAARLWARTQREAWRARSWAARQVEAAAPAAREALGGQGKLGTAPRWLTSQLDRTAQDGAPVVDATCAGVLIAGLLLSRALLLRLARGLFLLPFKALWFFCPVRFCMRRGNPSLPPAVEKRNGAEDKNVSKNMKYNGKKAEGAVLNTNIKVELQ